MMEFIYYKDRHDLDRGTTGSAGLDIRADLHGERERVIGGNNAPPIILSTGLRVAIPKGYFGMITLRSSLGKRGLMIPNAPGIIDSDYRGEIRIILSNTSSYPVHIADGERVAQLILVPYAIPERITRYDDYDSFREAAGMTPRGDGGFGSTGKT